MSLIKVWNGIIYVKVFCKLYIKCCIYIIIIIMIVFGNYYFVDIFFGFLISIILGVEGIGCMDDGIKFLRYLEFKSN